jgi:hypothetical protein
MAGLVKGQSNGGMIEKDQIDLVTPQNQCSAKIQCTLRDPPLMAYLVEFYCVAHHPS